MSLIYEEVDPVDFAALDRFQKCSPILCAHRPHRAGFAVDDSG